MLAKRTYKNQVTIPKAIMDSFPKVEYFDVRKQRNAIILRPVHPEPLGARTAKIRARIKALGLTEADVEQAIQWARRSAR
jgi:hypothetical protein